MKYTLVAIILCCAVFVSAQEYEIVYDTLIYSEDSAFVLLDPDFDIDEGYTYEVVSIDFRVKNGDTITNKNQLSRFSFVPISIDKQGVSFDLFLEEAYWEKIVLYDSIYSSWSMESVPNLRLKYLYSDNNFSVENHDVIGDYIYKYIAEAKTYIDADTSADSWNQEMADACLSKCQDSTVIRNWLSFSNGVFTLFSYYSFLFPAAEQLKYEINQSMDDFSMSTYFIVNKEQQDIGDEKYSIFEDSAMGRNSSDRMFEKMVESFSQLDPTSNSELYNSETEDATYVIVNPKDIIIEATTKSWDKAILNGVTSQSKSVFTVRRVK